MKEFHGDLTAQGYRYGILLSRFNSLITERLLEGALDALLRSGADREQIEVLRVPGAFEIPLVARRMVDSGRYDGIICLGAVIRGETPHFDYVAAEVTKGIAQISLEGRVPLAYGVLTTDNTDQALERAGNKMGNKGFAAAQSLMETLNLLRQAGI